MAKIAPIGEVNKAGWEVETCGRCGGGGSYSFNLMDGSRCYGCGGSGKRLTKRGAAARAMFMSLLEKPLSEVQPCQYVFMSATVAGPDVWNEVVSIEQEPSVMFEGRDIGGGLRLNMKYRGRAHAYSNMRPESVVRSVANEAERQAKMAEARAYQATLMLNGKPPAVRAPKPAAAAA